MYVCVRDEGEREKEEARECGKGKFHKFLFSVLKHMANQ